MPLRIPGRGRKSPPKQKPRGPGPVVWGGLPSGQIASGNRPKKRARRSAKKKRR